MGRVFVVGSVNVDLVVTVARLPAPGRTVTGGDLARHHGGKGGNQAVAAARLGAEVAFIGAFGDDELGRAAVRALAEEGVDTSQMVRAERPTGVALIVVDEAGQNMIAVAPGANAALDEQSVRAALRDLGIRSDDVVLASREVGADAVRVTLREGRAAGATTILNPAPAEGLDGDTRRLADLLTPNESELAAISRTSSPAEAGPLLLAEGGTRWLAVTRGGAGAVLVERGRAPVEFAAPRVEPIDTTGAGDAFNGATAALLAAGKSAHEAVELAVAAASYSTQRAGARDGMPSLDELRQFMAAA